MAKILITGAKGQLGQCLLDAASLFPNHHVVGYDINKLDICEPDAAYKTAKRAQAEVVINCAAYTDVDRAEQESDRAYALNRWGVRELVKACDRLGMVFIHLSTDYVFDGLTSTPYTEEDKPNPLSVYGASKFAGEAYALSYERGIVVRTSWLYAPHGANFLSSVLRLGTEQKELLVVNDQIGSPTFAPHLADALLRMAGEIERTEAHSSLMGLYHFSNQGACSRFDFVQKVKEYAPLEAEIVPVSSSFYPTPARRPAFSALHTKKIEETFGIVPPQWDEGIKSFITWKSI